MKRIGKWVGAVALGLVALVGIVALWGASLPPEHEASRTAHLEGSPEEVFALVTEVDRGSTWREGLDRVEVLGEVDGHPRWVEHTDYGPITMERIDSDPPRRVVVRIVDTGEGFGGTWTFELTPRDDGTDLTITERGWIENPVFRVLSKYVFGYTATMEAYLASAQQAIAPGS